MGLVGARFGRLGMARTGAASNGVDGRCMAGMEQPTKKGEDMVYQWKTGYYKTDAEVAGKVFDELEKTVGLSAKTLVDASRDETAPLHDEFEWDDAVAGEKWREQIARVMIGNLVVTVEDKPEAPPVRAYVQIEPSTGQYENIETVLKSAEKTDTLMLTAMRELNNFERKYSNLTAFAGVFREIRKLRDVYDMHDGRVAG